MPDSGPSLSHLRSSVFCCRKCTKINLTKTNAIYHAQAHGEFDSLSNVLLTEVEADAPRPALSIMTTVHSCTGCTAYRSTNRTNAVLHAYRCGGSVVKARVHLTPVLKNEAAPPAATPNPLPPAIIPPTASFACQLESAEFAKGEVLPTDALDPLFEEAVHAVSEMDVASSWLVLLDDEDEFDFVSTVAPIVCRLFKASTHGRLVDWTTSDGRRLCTKVVEFRRQLLHTCAAVCMEASIGLEGELAQKAGVFKMLMEESVDDWGISRFDCIKTWAGSSDVLLFQATQFPASQATQFPASQATQAAPATALKLHSHARQWLLKFCVPRIQTALV